MQVLCGLQVVFFLFNCQTLVSLQDFQTEQLKMKANTLYVTMSG